MDTSIKAVFDSTQALGEAIRASETYQALKAAETAVVMNPNDMAFHSAYEQAQSSFTQLLQQVNQVLQFVVTGETEPGCGRSCSGCAGCGPKQ